MPMRLQRKSEKDSTSPTRTELAATGENTGASDFSEAPVSSGHKFIAAALRRRDASDVGFFDHSVDDVACEIFALVGFHFGV
jgi:hypothetical protein